MSLEKMQEKVQAVTSVTTPGGAVASGAGALTLNEMLAIGGFAVAVISMLINWYYQHKRFKLLEEQKD